MSGETIQVESAYSSIVASAAILNTAFSVESSTVSTGVGTANDRYPLIDFKLDVTVAPVAAGTVNLYRRSGDGVDQAEIPSGTNKSKYVGSFSLTTVADQIYLSGVANIDKNDTYLLENTTGSSVTCQLFIRARSYSAAA